MFNDFVVIVIFRVLAIAPISSEGQTTRFKIQKKINGLFFYDRKDNF